MGVNEHFGDEIVLTCRADSKRYDVLEMRKASSSVLPSTFLASSCSSFRIRWQAVSSADAQANHYNLNCLFYIIDWLLRVQVHFFIKNMSSSIFDETIYGVIRK